MQEQVSVDPFCAFRSCQAPLAEPVEHVDCLGFGWCDEHWHRGEVLNWGARHDWPAIVRYSYIVPSGQVAWAMLMTFHRDDDVGYTFAEIIEELGENPDPIVIDNNEINLMLSSFA